MILYSTDRERLLVILDEYLAENLHNVEDRGLIKDLIKWLEDKPKDIAISI